MQDTDLFLSLAAGAFVGFGALISVRSGGASEAHEVTYIRGGGVDRDLGGHRRPRTDHHQRARERGWRGLVALVLFAVTFTMNGGRPSTGQTLLPPSLLPRHGCCWWWEPGPRSGCPRLPSSSPSSSWCSASSCG